MSLKNPLAIQQFLDHLLANEGKVTSNASAKETDTDVTVNLSITRTVQGGISKIVLDRTGLHDAVNTHFEDPLDPISAVISDIEGTSDVLTSMPVEWAAFVARIQAVMDANP